MGIIFNSNPFSIGSTSKIQLNNNPRVYFGNNPYADSFQNNSVEKLFDEKNIKAMIINNPELNKILRENKISGQLNMKELQDLKQNHCKKTQEVCAEIVKKLPPALKSDINIKDLKDGAMLHDIGKVFIPREILNKHGALTQDEHNVMKLHSEIGYLLLKNSGVNNRILYLVKNHHSNDGDIHSQILNIADKYSALTEERVYKKSMSPQQALTILLQEVQRGEIHPIIYYSLVQAVNSSNKNTIVNIS